MIYPNLSDDEREQLCLEMVRRYGRWESLTPNGKLSDMPQAIEDHKKWLEKHPEGKRLYSSHFPKNFFKGANLEGANLERAHLDYADFEGANLEGANLWKASTKYTNFKNACLKNANLQGTDLTKWALVQARLQGALLSRDLLKAAEDIIKDLNRMSWSQRWVNA